MHAPCFVSAPKWTNVKKYIAYLPTVCYQLEECYPKAENPEESKCMDFASDRSWTSASNTNRYYQYILNNEYAEEMQEAWYTGQQNLGTWHSVTGLLQCESSILELAN